MRCASLLRRPPDASAAWLQRLAVGMELRRRTEATAVDLAQVAVPLPEDRETLRRRLIESAPLRDVPDDLPSRSRRRRRHSVPMPCSRAASSPRCAQDRARRPQRRAGAARRYRAHPRPCVRERGVSEQRAALKKLDALRSASTACADLAKTKQGRAGRHTKLSQVDKPHSVIRGIRTKRPQGLRVAGVPAVRGDRRLPRAVTARVTPLGEGIA